MPITSSRPLYVRRRPQRSPRMPTVIAEIAMPARMAALSSPTATFEAPEAASDAPRITAPNPYRKARTAWIPRIRLRSARRSSFISREQSDSGGDADQNQRDTHEQPKHRGDVRAQRPARSRLQCLPREYTTPDGERRHAQQPDLENGATGSVGHGGHEPHDDREKRDRNNDEQKTAASGRVPRIGRARVHECIIAGPVNEGLGESGRAQAAERDHPPDGRSRTPVREDIGRAVAAERGQGPALAVGRRVRQETLDDHRRLAVRERVVVAHVELVTEEPEVPRHLGAHRLARRLKELEVVIEGGAPQEVRGGS